MATANIPFVDLDQYRSTSKEHQESFVKQLADAFQNIGFVGVKNHGISRDLVDTFYAEANAFFDMPADVKAMYEMEGLAGQRGFTSFGKEHAKQSNVGDLKEFFQIGQPNDDLRLDASDYPVNIGIAERPDFLKTGEKLYRAFENTGAMLLEAIAKHLDLPKDYFVPYIKDGNSILRAIHYPPITEEPKSAIRAEQHEDINLITLLVGASAEGLQVMDLEGDWINVATQANEIVVNVGDMLQRLTNNYLKSTTHRVVNPPREKWSEPRLSIPFFLHPVSDMKLNCLDQCVSQDKPQQYPDITAGDYLDQRLREIGLK